MSEEALLTEAEKGFFQRFSALFESDEWQLLVTEWSRDLDALPTRAFWQAKSWDEILAARALHAKLSEYLAYPNEIELRRQHLIEQREQELEDNRDYERPDV